MSFSNICSIVRVKFRSCKITIDLDFNPQLVFFCRYIHHDSHDNTDYNLNLVNTFARITWTKQWKDSSIKWDKWCSLTFSNRRTNICVFILLVLCFSKCVYRLLNQYPMKSRLFAIYGNLCYIAIEIFRLMLKKYSYN